MKSLYQISFLLGLALLLLMSSCQSSRPFVLGPFGQKKLEAIAATDTSEWALKKQFRKQERELKQAQRKAEKLAKAQESKDIEKVIKTARSYHGTPYKWGGTTRIGMDCSGLLCTSFHAINVELPRTSKEQSTFGKQVPLHSIQKGDLVFFGEPKNRRQIVHVGLVTEVNGKEEVKFIHASTRLGVTEDNLYSNYYRNIFIKAVRPKLR